MYIILFKCVPGGIRKIEKWHVRCTSTVHIVYFTPVSNHDLVHITTQHQLISCTCKVSNKENTWMKITSSHSRQRQVNTTRWWRSSTRKIWAVTSDLGLKLVSLTPNGSNPGLFHNIWANTYWHLIWKHSIWPNLGPTLTSIFVGLTTGLPVWF